MASAKFLLHSFLRLPVRAAVILFLFAAWCTLAEESLSPNNDRSRRCDECVHNAMTINRLIENSTSINSSDAKAAIDWHEVEANFNKVLSEDEVFHKWDTMEANMKSGFL